MADLTLLRPEWLLAVPLVALAALVLVHRTGRIGGWDRAVDPHLLAELQRTGRMMPGRVRRDWLPFCIAGLVALCLSGPALLTERAPSWRNLGGVVLVVDVSTSVRDSGFMAEAITTAQRVTTAVADTPAALIVYAGDAYMASGFTTDAAVLGSVLSSLDTDLVPDAGSRPDRGLEQAAKLLTRAGILTGDIVLISDGGGLTGDSARLAADLALQDRRVFALYVPDAEDRPVPASLRDVASRGDGLTASVRAPGPVLDALAAEDVSRLVQSDFAPLLYRDYGRYLLFLALLPCLFLIRRSAS